MLLQINQILNGVEDPLISEFQGRNLREGDDSFA